MTLQEEMTFCAFIIEKSVQDKSRRAKHSTGITEIVILHNSGAWEASFSLGDSQPAASLRMSEKASKAAGTLL